MGRTNFALFAILVAAATSLAAPESEPWQANVRRWPHARGTASKAGLSQAASSEGLEAWLWHYTARSTIQTTPLVWDDLCFLLDGDTIVVLSVDDGSVIARAKTKGVASGTEPALHARAIFVLEGQKLAQYQLRADKLERRWTIDVGAAPTSPAIARGEIYLTGGGALQRLRAAVPAPLWKVDGAWTGEVAVLGQHVYALRRQGRSVELVALKRTDGSVVTSIKVGSGTGLRVALSNKNVAVELERGRWSLLQREGKKDGAVTLKAGREVSLHTAPLVGGRAFLCRRVGKKEHFWSILRATSRGKRTDLVSAGERGDLFTGEPPPVGLSGGTITFGAWCYDLNINRILWNVRETQSIAAKGPSPKAFAAGTKFGVAPADHRRVILVSLDGKLVSLLGTKESDS